MTNLLQLLVTGIMIGSIYAMVALGLVLIFKCSGVLNFAQGQILLIGAYVCWAFLVQLGLPLWISILLSLILCSLLGLAIERFPLRPLVGQSILSMVMATIALSVIIEGMIAIIWSGPLRTYGAAFPAVEITFAGLSLTAEHVWAFLISAVLLLAFTLFFRYSRVGLAMRGIAEGHEVAQSLGMNVNAIIAITWAIACGVAMAGGFLMGQISGVSLSLSAIGLRAFPAAFIGGLESLPGAVIGGLLIGIVENLVSGYIGLGFGSAAAFIILIVFLYFRPYGLFGLKKIERV